ncbi:redoxin domain-containing protein [Rubrolithibacter danxiaensis]|uniref:redoxin domain-containing protein n=1 Tax=Rubrolithibacter danxiaensis TaxID=3390805 RepID=UPI003BF8A02B
MMSLTLTAQPLTVYSVKKISSVTLLTLSGKQKKLVTDKPTVFVFLSTDCPLCKNYARVLNTLKSDFPEIRFYGIFPGKTSLEAIKTYQKDYNAGFELLSDPSKKLTSYLHATTTPQAILINTAGNLLYTGLIDNWAFSLGKQRQVVTEHYLKTAIKQFLNKEPIETKSTKPIGCLINDI